MRSRFYSNRPGVKWGVGRWSTALFAALAVRAAAGAENPEARSAGRPVLDAAVRSADRAVLQQALQPLLDASEAEVAELVPRRNGLLFCGCPHCDRGAQDRQLEWLGWPGPDRVRCRYCGMVFPNARYAEDRRLIVRNPQGEPVAYRYYQQGGRRYFFSARARYSRKRWAAQAALQLARLAYLTGDPAIERKAVVLLDAFGQCYPRWCVMADRAVGQRGPLDSHPERPRPYYGGVWSRWFYDDIPDELLLAYDLVRGSPQWRRLEAEQGRDVRRRLEQDVFHAAVRFVRGYEERMSNKSPNLYRGLIIAGRVLGEPEYVHDGVRRFRRFVSTRFFLDGLWCEGSVSYHRQTIGALARVAEAAAGYADPPDFHPPGGEPRFQRLDLIAQFPFFQRILRAHRGLLFPDGGVVAVHDAWPNERYPELADPATRLLAGAEHACLHAGVGEDQVEARLHFAPGYGHKHRDLLSLILWAGGKELLSDIGYTHTAYRKAWSRSAVAHNTVVVDEREQETDGDRCELTLFDQAPGLARTVEAESNGAYPDRTTVYRRQLLLIEAGPGRVALIDVFRVAGGRRHDWLLHGSADEDQSLAASLPLAPSPGTLLGPAASFRLPVHEHDPGDAGGRNIAYAFIRQLRQAETDLAWSVTFQFAENPAVKLRTTVLGQPGTTVVCGRCPSIRRAGEDDSLLDRYTMPVVVARRSGQRLSSVFAAVHEPYRKRPEIRHVRALLPLDDARSPVALEIDRGADRDVIICSLDDGGGRPLRVASEPPIEFAGRTAVVRLRNGRVADAWLLGAGSLRCGGASQQPHADNPRGCLLQTPSAPHGVVRGVRRAGHRFALVVDERLPEDGSLRGRTVIVELPDGARHGYPIAGVRRAGRRAWILLEHDPGFVVGEDGRVRFLYVPQRTLSGDCRYEIQPAARLRR